MFSGCSGGLSIRRLPAHDGLAGTFRAQGLGRNVSNTWFRMRAYISDLADCCGALKKAGCMPKQDRRNSSK